MKKILLSLLLFGVFVGPAYSYIDYETAVFNVMDKAAGKVQTIHIPVGKTIKFEKLTLNVRACKQTDPFQASDWFAFVEISKSDGDLIFSNWMSHNDPGDNPLQNPDYDVWLVNCE